jgi:predicted ArsR family transcriptional regulator
MRNGTMMHSSEDRVLQTLKSRGAQSTQAIARQLTITLPGARKHLTELQHVGLVASDMVAAGVGRPKRMWRLTDKAQSRFPDTHAFLTIELIGAARNLFGEDGIDRLINQREKDMHKRYQAALQKARGLRAKVAKLCELRSEEGYMAEWSALADGAFLLAENHCPICAAARLCQGFCRSELNLFAAVLGPGTKVERIEHIVSGARRCAYRIASQS